MKRSFLIVIAVIFAALALAPALPARSLDEIFPALAAEWRDQVSAPGGVIRTAASAQELFFSPAPGSGIDILGAVLRRQPGYLAESLALVPYPGRRLDRRDLYNVLGKVGDLQGRRYHSASRGADIALFEEAARIPGRNSRAGALPDPPDAAVLPAGETIYLRLKDVNFGSCYYQAEIAVTGEGLSCGLSNTKRISYRLFTVMKEDRFVIELYLEPLEEGVLIYSVAGAEVPDLVARMTDMSSAIRKRMQVFIGWLSDGIASRGFF